MTGLCEKGCDAGWTGAKCQKGIYIYIPYVFNGCIYIWINCMRILFILELVLTCQYFN